MTVLQADPEMSSVWCPTCRTDRYTWLRHNYLGRVTVWFCTMCHQIAPTVRLVKDESPDG